jgi:glycosyltransferase involved in cell wall biosynthesis
LDQRSIAPENLVEAVRKAGGTCLILDPMVPFLERAQQLRNYAWENADVVVLHIHPEDVIATTAFGVAGGPPVLFVNHADHAFWVGCAIADLVLDIRTSGHLWTKEGRGVNRTTILTLPLIQGRDEPNGNTMDPQQKCKIRRELGISEEGIMFLTVGSAAKYDPIGGHDFIQTAMKILRECKDAHLIAVGPSDHGRWKEARLATGGRLRAIGRQPDSTLFCKAADIYLEGFPAGSLTALLEAGESGLPFVRGLRSCAPPYSSDGIGIDEVLQPMDTSDYVCAAVKLAQDSKTRVELGQKLQRLIRSNYCGTGWLTRLEAVKKLIPESHAVYPEFSPTPVDQSRRDWHIEYLHAKDRSFTKTTLVSNVFVEAWRRTNDTPQIDKVLWEKLNGNETIDKNHNGLKVEDFDPVALGCLNTRIRNQGFRSRLIDRASLAVFKGKYGLARNLTYRLLLTQVSCAWDLAWLKLLAKVNGGYHIRAGLRNVMKFCRLQS